MSTASHLRDYESELANLLSDLAAVQEELLDVLAKKRERMASGDLEGMTDLQPQEEQLCQRLQNCHDRRAGLLELASAEGIPAGSIGELAGVVDSGCQGGLQKRVKGASAKMRLLQHQSLTNWVAAQRSLLHLAQILEIVATGGRLQPTYGKGNAANSRGSLVDQEV